MNQEHVSKKIKEFAGKDTVLVPYNLDWTDKMTQALFRSLARDRVLLLIKGIEREHVNYMVKNSLQDLERCRVLKVVERNFQNRSGYSTPLPNQLGKSLLSALGFYVCDAFKKAGQLSKFTYYAGEEGILLRVSEI